jgi:hypothetical protein
MATSPVTHADVSSVTCLRLQDEAMINWLKGIRLRGQAAHIVTGWNSRAFSQAHQLIDGKPTKQSMPLPLVSLTQTTVTPDMSRWVYTPTTYAGGSPLYTTSDINGSDAVYSCHSGLRKFSGASVAAKPIIKGSMRLTFTIGGITYTEWDDGKCSFTNDNNQIYGSTIRYSTGSIDICFNTAPDEGTVINCSYTAANRTATAKAPFPMPITIGYQVDIWSKTQQDTRFLREGVLTRFEVSPISTWVTVNLPFYGEKLVFIDLVHDVDNSDLESGEGERELRHTITLDMHGWIFKEPEVVKTIMNKHIVAIDANPTEEEEAVSWFSDNSHYSFNSDFSQILSVDQDGYTPPDRVLFAISWDADGNLHST